MVRESGNPEKMVGEVLNHRGSLALECETQKKNVRIQHNALPGEVPCDQE